MKKGFSLIELLIGLVIFMLILFTMQSFISGVFSSTFRALAMKKLADSTRNALEIMGREMRLAQEDGTGCTTGGASFEVLDPGPTEGKTIKFQDFTDPGQCIQYIFTPPSGPTPGKIEKKIDAAAAQLFLGGSGIDVEHAEFKLIEGASQQARVIINMRVNTADPSSPSEEMEIELQTTVSRREL